MTWEEFRDRGYLQEVNRLFFHPLGLALALGKKGGDEYLDELTVVWDGRDDPEGFVFEDLDEVDLIRGDSLADEMRIRLQHRQEALGFGIQPLELTTRVGRD